MTDMKVWHGQITAFDLFRQRYLSGLLPDGSHLIPADTESAPMPVPVLLTEAPEVASRWQAAGREDQDP